MHLTADPLLILTALAFLVPWARLATALRRSYYAARSWALRVRMGRRLGATVLVYAATMERRDTWPLGSDFAANLPSPGVSLAELAFAVAENLIRHGYIKRELRDALRSARPNRAADIDAVFSAAGI